MYGAIQPNFESTKMRKVRLEEKQHKPQRPNRFTAEGAPLKWKKKTEEKQRQFKTFANTPIHHGELGWRTSQTKT